MTLEWVEVVFVFVRIVACIVLLFSALLALRLTSLYKWGILREPWGILLLGILIFASAQIMAASSVILESFSLRMATASLSLVGSLVIFVGLMQLVNAWQKLTRS